MIFVSLFRFLLPIDSCDLNQRVKIRIGSLEGNIPEKDFQELLDDPIAPFRKEQLVLIGKFLFISIFLKNFRMIFEIFVYFF